MSKRVPMGRYGIAQTIEGLDPKQDAIAICYLLAGYEFSCAAIPKAIGLPVLDPHRD